MEEPAGFDFAVADPGDSGLDSSAPSGKIYVGSLEKGCTKLDIEAAFCPLGAIVSIDVNPKGFAFVEFEDPDVAQLILDNHEHNEIDGKWVDCQPATKKSPASTGKRKAIQATPIHAEPEANAIVAWGQDAEASAPPGKLFVGGLPPTATEESLTLYFSEFGEVRQLVVPTQEDGSCKGFAFVFFEDEAVTSQVLDMGSGEFDGQQIDFRRPVAAKKQSATKKRKVAGGGSRRGANQAVPCTVVAHNLPRTAMRHHIFAFFAKFGDIANIDINFAKDGQSSTSARVTFRDQSAGEEVMLSHKSNNLQGQWVDCQLDTDNTGGAGNAWPGDGTGAAGYQTASSDYRARASGKSGYGYGWGGSGSGAPFAWGGSPAWPGGGGKGGAGW